VDALVLKQVEVDGLTVAYRELGEGPTVLLLHGWPTSSYLWREVVPPIAAANRVVAIDLPGFGASEKPLDADYGFDFHAGALDGFLDALGIEQVALGVHDLGGPIGLDWARRNSQRVTALALLNTLVYPEFSEAVLAFVDACSKPETRQFLSSPAGLEAAMQLGLADPTRLTDETLAAVCEPFATEDARIALMDAGKGLEPAGFERIAAWLPTIEFPVRVVYGAQDRILPEIAETMTRLAADVPQAEITALPNCGHFLQEEEPAKIGALLAEFFAQAST
jgi:pimeloyl-ACP methyl ester carboxylesterase